MNRDEIIRDALELCGVISPAEAISSEDLATCARRLNQMVKFWMVQGIHLWAMEEGTLFLVVGTQSYQLGATGTHATNSYVQTTLSAAAASGATSLTLTATTGIANSDNIGIVLDSGAIHWTTVSSVGSPTTIATGLASAAASGNVVFAYTAKLERPQRIQSMYRRSIDTQDIPLRLIGRDEYVELSNKTTQGKPIQAFYDPQLTLGTLYVWPTADLSTDVIRFWYERPIQDFDVASDNPDFPIEWAELLILGLADRIGLTFSVPREKRAQIKLDLDNRLSIAMGYDRENASVTFMPDFR